MVKEDVIVDPRNSRMLRQGSGEHFLKNAIL